MYGPRTSLVSSLAAVLLAIPCAQARNYYISPTGSDGAAGTLNQPLQSIQKAASFMVAGDTAYIRAGVYRETVIPKASGSQTSPIAFQAYQAESVTVSGADPVAAGSWTPSTGNIYQGNLPWDLGDGANQVFLDGQMMIEARWPNTTLDVSHPAVALTSRGSYVDGGAGPSTATISSSQLPARPAGYWNGATLNICLGSCWVWQTARVTGSSAQQLTFSFTKQGDLLLPGAGNSYFLSGKLTELDSPGEWFRDAATATLYFWTPRGDSPAQHTVEVKRRQLAFDLSGRSFITVQGIGIFAATIRSDAQSQNLVLDGLQAKYIAHVPLPAGLGSYYTGGDAGIALRGRNNVLRNSTVAFSSGSGVWLEGAGQRVLNNVIRDTGYRSTYASPIFAGAGAAQQNQHLLAYNTIYNSGRFGIYHAQNFGTGRIVHNEIYDYGLQTNDLGCTYTWMADGKATEIAYNLCHDGHGLILPPETETYVAGIYLDDGSGNFVVHHNVVWNAQWALHLNNTGANDKIYNNTFVGSGSSFIPYGDAHLPGSEIRNNIFVAPIRANPIGAIVTNNVLPGTDPQFVDPDNHNYQLKRASPAIAAGARIPPYTDGFTGPAPDIGAYDHAKPAWKAGMQAAAYTFSAASYGPGIAAGSIAIVFGTVPFDAGVSVVVTDGAGADLPADLLYVAASPPQMAFVVPGGAAPGVAMITITNGDGTVSISSAPLFTVAPGLIAADSSGQGIAAAGFLRVKADGSQSYGPIASYDPAHGTFAAIPIDLGAPSDQVFVILYGTGIRGRSSLNNVQALVGDVSAQVTYAGPQNQFAGLDQVNALLPRSLTGKGSAGVILTVDGQPTNTVTVTIK